MERQQFFQHFVCRLYEKQNKPTMPAGLRKIIGWLLDGTVRNNYGHNALVKRKVGHAVIWFFCAMIPTFVVIIRACFFLILTNIFAG